MLPGPRTEGGPWLVPGWVSETVTTIGTRGFETPGAPTQETLGEQPLSDMLTGELRTVQQLEGDAETQAGIERAEALLGASDQPGEAFDTPLGLTIDDEEDVPLL